MKTTGLNNILNNLSKLDITSRVEGVVKDVGDQILGQAKANVDSEKIRSDLSITQSKEGDTFIVSVGSGLKIAPFHEFGTGHNVFKIVNGQSSFVASDKEYAREFYETGEGYRYARPYLLPAYYQHRPKLAVKLAQLINSMTK